jgi:hypothetical protein
MSSAGSSLRVVTASDATNVGLVRLVDAATELSG